MLSYQIIPFMGKATPKLGGRPRNQRQQGQVVRKAGGHTGATSSPVRRSRGQSRKTGALGTGAGTKPQEVALLPSLPIHSHFHLMN